MATRIGVLFGCATVLVLLAGSLHAKPGIVKTADGQTYEGDVTEEGTTVTVKTRKVPVVIQRADIESIEYLGTLDEQYAQRIARLDAKDVNGRVTVARWAFDQGRYDLSRQALESALTLEPGNKDANVMMDSVRLQIRLERARLSTTRPAPTTSPTTNPPIASSGQPSATTVTIDPRNLLSADDINAIRQFELKPTDTHVRLNFARDVKKRFAQQENIRVQDFNALPQFEQLQQILKHGTADMKRDVRILSDPSAVLEYRRNVQTLLLQGCATTGCHGAAGAGRLMLYSPADSEAITYTNFYIVQTWARPTGQQQGPFAAGERRLVDRLEPRNSLLLQFALPPSIADDDHPVVNAHRATFRNRDDNGYRRIETWIADSLISIKPDYGITFTPPQRPGGTRGEPATAPATSEAPPTTQPTGPTRGHPTTVAPR